MKRCQNNIQLLLHVMEVHLGAFGSQDISEHKVQNAAKQTQLSAQGQRLLSKGFCSLLGSRIHMKVLLTRVSASHASLRKKASRPPVCVSRRRIRGFV